ncbi:MAG TPA: hypothetical protein VJ869_15515 [Sphaerochaeta sp.]|nr:hypothetical protein [Sphaerochaeta sp.]
MTQEWINDLMSKNTPQWRKDQIDAQQEEDRLTEIQCSTCKLNNGFGCTVYSRFYPNCKDYKPCEAIEYIEDGV